MSRIGDHTNLVSYMQLVNTMTVLTLNGHQQTILANHIRYICLGGTAWQCLTSRDSDDVYMDVSYYGMKPVRIWYRENLQRTWKPDRVIVDALRLENLGKVAWVGLLAVGKPEKLIITEWKHLL